MKIKKFLFILYFVVSFNLFSENLTLKVQDADIRDIFKLLSFQYGINLIISEEVKGVISLNFNNVTLDEAFAILSKTADVKIIKENNIYRVISASKVTASETETRIYHLKYIEASQAISYLKDIISKEGKISTFKNEKNAEAKNFILMVSDSKDNLEKIDKLISEIDKKSSQIMIKAKIVEISYEDRDRLGVEWQSKNDIQKRIYVNTKGVNNINDEDGFFLNFGTISSEKLSMTLQALFENTKANLLSNPSILTKENEKATILVGEEVPYKVTNTQNTGESQQTVQFKEVGIKLEVVGRIIEENSLMIDLYQEISEVLDKNVENIPRIAKRQMKTNFEIKNGETIVLGGLIRENVIEVKTRIPIIGNLPLIGELFSNKKNDNRKTELMIFVTASIEGK